MPPRRKSYTTETFQPLLSRNGAKGDILDHKDIVTAIGKLACGCVSEGSAVYLRKAKDGSITVRVYSDDERYEESIRHDDDPDLLAEEMLEALFGQQIVAKWRRAAVGQRAESRSAGRNRPNPSQDTGEGDTGA